MAQICASSGASGEDRQRARKLVTGWLCWQSEANPSLPAKVGNAGRFRQKAGKAAIHPRRKSRHLNPSDLPLPNVASRENLIRSREANTADKVFGTHKIVADLELDKLILNESALQNDLENQSIHTLLVDKYNIPLTQASYTIAARILSSTEAELLQPSWTSLQASQLSVIR